MLKTKLKKNSSISILLNYSNYILQIQHILKSSNKILIAFLYFFSTNKLNEDIIYKDHASIRKWQNYICFTFLVLFTL